MLIPQHFMIPATPWFLMFIAYDEIRKLMIRRGMNKEGKLVGWCAQNLYY